MNIVQSWKDSLLLLLPQNFKLFALVTLKSIMDTYKTLFKYWWFLYVMATVCTGLLFWIGVRELKPGWYDTNSELFKQASIYHLQTILYMLGMIIALAIIYIACLFIVCLTARSSIKQKNYRYYFDYLKRYWYLLCIIFLLYVRINGVPIKSIPLMYSFSIILFLFTFDARPSLKALWRSGMNSLRFMVYNMPLLVLLELFVRLIDKVMIFINYLFVAAALVRPFHVGGITFVGLSTAMLSLILSPILIVILTNLYIKRVHDQPELYFPTPK